MNSYDEREYKELIENIVYMFEVVPPENRVAVWQSVVGKINPLIINSLKEDIELLTRLAISEVNGYD